MNDFYKNEPDGFKGIEEISALKSKKHEDDLKKLAEKNRKKRTGLVGKLKGIEENIEVSQKLFLPYWLLKYSYSQKKGLFRKKTVEADNVMVLEGCSGSPCSDAICCSGLRKMNILTAILKWEKEKVSITGTDAVVPPLTLEEAVREVRREVAEKHEQVERLLSEADILGRQIAPDCRILDELESRARYIRERIQALASERQVNGVFEMARGGVRTLTGGRTGLGDIASGLRHGLWSGRTGGSNPVEGFINRCLNPGDIQAMGEAQLRGLLEEVNALIYEYRNQLEPYLREVEGKRAKAYEIREKLRASTNLPKKAEAITDYQTGELIFYPYRCIKYSGVNRKGDASTRWLVINGINGDIDKKMGESIHRFLPSLS